MKTRTKILLILGTMLIALICGTNNVKALKSIFSEATGEVQKGTITLENIPDTIDLDMKQVKTEELAEEIFNKIAEALAKQDIIISSNVNANAIRVNMDCNFSTSQRYIDKAEVIIGEARKQISINWSNKVSYNPEDEKIMLSILAEKGAEKVVRPEQNYEFYVVRENISKELGEKADIPFMEKELLQETQRKLKNNGFEVLAGSGAGDGCPFGNAGEEDIHIFKNNVYYGRVFSKFIITSKVTVPNDIEDIEEAYINYALPKLQAHLKSKGYNENIKVEKVSGYWYSVSYKELGYIGNGNYGEVDRKTDIIIKKEDGIPVGNVVYVDNLEKGGEIHLTVTKNEAIETELINKGYSKILGSYELKLYGIQKLTNPINVTFKVGTEHNNKMVYIIHQKNDGQYENFEKKVIDGKVTITVSELSPFVIATKETVQEEKPVNKGEKDETPPTGTIDIISYILGITLLAGIGIVATKKSLK